MFTRLTLKKSIRRLIHNALLSLMVACTVCTTAYAKLPTLGDPTLTSFSAKDEQQYGLAFYRSLRANLTHFFMIKAPTINAFAGPAAYIGIHTQLILEAENESV